MLEHYFADPALIVLHGKQDVVKTKSRIDNCITTWIQISLWSYTPGCNDVPSSHEAHRDNSINRIIINATTHTMK